MIRKRRNTTNGWLGGTRYTVALAVALAAVITAGADVAIGSRTDGTSVARQRVAQALKAPTPKVPGPSFNANAARGKTAWFINTCDCNVVANIWFQGFKHALERYGVKVVDYDGKYNVAQYNRGMQRAIAQNADAILTLAVTPQVISHQISVAASKKIPFISTTDGVPELKKNRDYVPGIVGEVTYDYGKVGRLEADWFIADSGGKGHALFISNLDQPSSFYIREGFLQEVKSLCPDCKVDTADVPAGLAAQQVPTLTRTTIQRDPSINYIVPGYDLNVPSVLAALKTGNLIGKVRVGSWNAIPAVMTQVKDPKNTSAQMEMGAPNAWFGYAMADAVLRVLTGHKAITQGAANSNYFGIRMFNKQTVRGMVVNRYDDQSQYGVSETAIAAAYQKVWGKPTK